LIVEHWRPTDQSSIVRWPFPGDQRLGEPWPGEHYWLISAQNGNPRSCGQSAKVYPCQIQIHNCLYKHEQFFEAARRSRVCTSLANDGHGPHCRRCCSPAVEQLVSNWCGTTSLACSAGDSHPAGSTCETMPNRKAVPVAISAEFGTTAVLDKIIAALDAVRPHT
jgi:hypothetical protein